MKTYDVGDEPLLFVTFKDSDEQLADPSAVTLEVMKPDGTKVTYTTVDFTHAAGSGYYTKKVMLDQSGLWRYKWFGTGDLNASDPGVFAVRESVFD